MGKKYLYRGQYISDIETIVERYIKRLIYTSNNKNEYIIINLINRQDLYDVRFKIFWGRSHKTESKWKGNLHHKVVNSCQLSL